MTAPTSSLASLERAELDRRTAPVGPYYEVRLKRARDLTDTDVIRHEGHWREVVAVHDNKADFFADMGIGTDEPAPYAAKYILQANAAFDRALETYVIVRLWLHEKGDGYDPEDRHITMYRNELVEVQALTP